MRNVIIALLIIIPFLAGCTTQTQVDYSKLSEDELITLYYETDAKLSIALDNLENARAQQTEGFAKGFSQGFWGGRVAKLRKQRAVILAEMHKRGVRLPR